MRVPPHARLWFLFEMLILLVLAAGTLVQIPLAWLFLDTTTIGGDTPAHNYLASQLREQLFQHGRVVGWAPGWWAGFPAFQYYFSLPYLLIVLLDLAMPFNVAFKLVSVSGLLALPPAAYAAARSMRLPRPAPILLAIAMLPFLFVQAHTMWGVNVYSTLAGMLANSLSFPIMLITIGWAVADANTARPRARTALAAALLLSSHFFTSIMAGLTLALLPLLHPRGQRLNVLRGLAQTGLLAFLLMAWWLIPLMATRAYSVDFGVNWAVTLRASLPRLALGLLPLAACALVLAPRRGHTPAVALIAWMGAASALLFHFGFGLTPVFVNVRLWPFVCWALFALGAIGLGLATANARARPWLVLAALVAALLTVARGERHPPPGLAAVRDWAAFNYRGLEHRPGHRALRELLLPLDGTPGRLAGDLAEANNAMGSSRILEVVPHLIAKPVLEGGLVNSALSSYFVYYIQCETSTSCAGYPTLMAPTGFNLDVGTRRLEHFNVKQFLARAPAVQRALRADPRWRHRGGADEWELFELDTHAGTYVHVAGRAPLAVASADWKALALEWWYRPEWLDQPVVFLQPGQTPPPNNALVPITAADLRRGLAADALRQSGDIEEWLHLGPLKPPRNGDPLGTALIPEPEADPREHQRDAGRRWRALLSPSPIHPGRFYDRSENIVAYSFVNLFVPDERPARLHYAHDDGAAIWLNGQAIVRAPDNTGYAPLRSAPVTLRAGRNRLLHKSTQYGGAHFFQVRITDANGLPFTDLAASLATAPPAAPPLAPRTERPAAAPGVVWEQVERNRIRFTTDAIGEPHLIKMSYFPNWRAQGAGEVYLVSPAFMLVIPTQREVTLSFARTPADRLGIGLTGMGLLLLAGSVLPFGRAWRQNKTLAKNARH